MKKRISMVFLAVIILAGAAFFIFKNDNNPKEEAQKTSNGSEMVFFYGQGCSYCANVEKFLEENKSVEEKVKFDKKEVWSNEKNADLMVEKAKLCGMLGDSLPVPLFWDGSKCFTGDVDIINLLKNKASIQ